MPQAMPLTQYISENSTKSIMHRTLTNQYGDGYSQRAADGLNSNVDQWDVYWIPVTSADRTTIVTALDAVGGWDYLTWTPPGDVSAIKVVLKDKYTMRFVADRYQISATFIQVFDL